MSPLMLRIKLGQEDARLSEHIDNLEAMKKNGGMSQGERDTLIAAYERLEFITRQ